MNGVIDLKKREQNIRPDSSSLFSYTSDSYEWRAAEYEKKERNLGWFFGVGGLGGILILISALAGNHLFIAFLALAAITFFLFFREGPREISCAIAPEGLIISEWLYPFSEFSSFWIFENGKIRELSLETKKTISPRLRVPLGDADSEKIRALLSQRLPEKEHAELITDQIARTFGL